MMKTPKYGRPYSAYNPQYSQNTPQNVGHTSQNTHYQSGNGHTTGHTHSSHTHGHHTHNHHNGHQEYRDARFQRNSTMLNYNKFNLERIKRRFDLKELKVDLFPHLTPIEPSSWLNKTLDLTADLQLKSEKAKSEFILTPLLLELRALNDKFFSIYSGERFDVDPKQGMIGFTDFILSMNPQSYSVSAPFLVIVQAHRNNMEFSIGKCAAQMVAADIFNERANNPITSVFGCITTGEQWQFLKLEGDTIYIDSVRYYINERDKIIGAFQAVVDFFQNSASKAY